MGADFRLRAQSGALTPRLACQWQPIWRQLTQREERLRFLPDWFLLFEVYGSEDRMKGRF